MIQKNKKLFYFLIICCFILHILIRNIIPLNVLPLNIQSFCFIGIIGLIIIILPLQSKGKIKKVGALKAIKSARKIGSLLIVFAFVVLFTLPH